MFAIPQLSPNHVYNKDPLGENVYKFCTYIYDVNLILRATVVLVALEKLTSYVLRVNCTPNQKNNIFLVLYIKIINHAISDFLGQFSLL